ncbi:MAG: hypothetical protein CMI36_12785 [Owenweeksia sp.]|nr:hypothetical protein [Owenweeksia sp.]MBF99862.1 hypothetical protein [Owenweeksia sp.]HCQ17263.1 hypothetical protein [Cryomorphaceae bacterium]|tara:strand:+ start:28482 stop:28997 length:516 start_codon:yes stop_codon:yes gene_type:complete
MDYSWLLIISMGVSSVKADLNSHQLSSEPGVFAETSLMYQTPKSGHTGIRLTYFSNTLPVRDIFRDRVGNTVNVKEIIISPYVGGSRSLWSNGRFYLDLGPQWQLYRQFGLGGRFQYLHKVKLKRGKRFYVGTKLGADYWAFDLLDGYQDRTDQMGDVAVNGSISVAFPLQ